MSPIGSLRTRLRSLLGEQVPRAVPRRSRKPRIGSYVVHVEEGLRLVLQAGVSDALDCENLDHRVFVVGASRWRT